MIELQSLVGDSTDNVPGVPGIGPKTAAQLLDEYGDLDTLLSRALGDQAAEAAREPDRACGAGAHLAQAGDAFTRRAARRAARRPRGRGRRRDEGGRFLQGHGIRRADEARRRQDRRRPRRDRAGGARDRRAGRRRRRAGARARHRRLRAAGAPARSAARRAGCRSVPTPRARTAGEGAAKRGREAARARQAGRPCRRRG